MNAVEFRGFSFVYQLADEPVLRGVDWCVPQGEFALLVGATGSGKSTLLRSLKPELAVSGTKTGEVLVMGESVEGLSVAFSAQTVGYVSQSPENQVVCDTVWHELAFGLENLGMPREQMRRRVAEVATFFGMEDMMDVAVSSLSGGQMQMLTLASVMALRPRVILFDEPTAQLDPVAEKSFCHAIFRINRELGVTVVVATHAPESFADYASSCARLCEGVIAPESLDGLRQRVRENLPARGQRALSTSANAVACSARRIALHDVWFRYGKQDPWVLRAFGRSFAPGLVHAIVGGNGSGKTTLLKLIAGTAKVGHGKVTNEFRGCQALLPQNPKTLFACDSVFEELMEWSSRFGYGEEEASKAAGEFGLSAALKQHPYDLSGGQQQMLAFAKVMLTNPDLLLLDEPTKGLDAHAKLAVAEKVADARDRGCTIILVTHDLSFAASLADEVTMVFDGEATCTESASEFFADNIFYRPPYDEFVKLWNGAR